MSKINYNNLPKTIVSPFTGNTLKLVYEEKNRQNHTYPLCVGDYEDGEFCYNDTIQAMYVSDDREEALYTS